MLTSRQEIFIKHIGDFFLGSERILRIDESTLTSGRTVAMIEAIVRLCKSNKILSVFVSSPWRRQSELMSHLFAQFYSADEDTHRIRFATHEELRKRIDSTTKIQDDFIVIYDCNSFGDASIDQLAKDYRLILIRI